MIVLHEETLWSPAPQPMDDDGSLGSKGLLQPTFDATLARAIRTLIEYVIFAHSSPGWTRTRTINTAKLERFIVRDLTD